MRCLVRNAAAERLSWILDGIDGQPGWGVDAAEVIAPEFAARVPPDRTVHAIRALSRLFAPVEVRNVDLKHHAARAPIRDHEGGVTVVACTVEPDPPHRITAIRTSGLVPAGLAPRLPMDFAGYDLTGVGDRTQLIVFSGLPGAGKSTLADATGRQLGIPVFAADWLLGSLTPFGGYYLDGLLDIGSELLTTLAVRQLALGQSAILDFPAEDLLTRRRWQTLAGQAGSDFKVVVCVCSDLQVHQARLENRERGIPGWHEGGNWANVQRRLAEFPPWHGDVLTIDTVQPRESNVAAVLGYL